MRHRYLALLLGTALACSSVCHAQVTVATAQRRTVLEAGVGLTVASPDYSQGLNKGITGFVAADLPHHLGIEFEYHNADIISPYDVGEISYLGGIRYRLPHGRFQPYVKALAGIGHVKLDQGYYQSSSESPKNFVFGFGGGLEYEASRRIMVRAIDFELQNWPGFGAHSLTPYLFTSGAAYRF